MSPSVYVGLLHGAADDAGWLETARAREDRLTNALHAISVVGIIEPGALLVLPAGLLRSPSETAVLAGAERLREESRTWSVDVAFGVDIELADATPGTSPQSLLFACKHGEPVLWAAKQVRPTRRVGPPGPPAEKRVFTLGGRRVFVALGAEIFGAGVRRAIADTEPQLIAVPTHAGPGHRWDPMLETLAKTAPLVVSGEAKGAAPRWMQPAGWQHAVVSRNRGISVLALQPPSTLAAWAPAPAGDTPAALAC